MRAAVCVCLTLLLLACSSTDPTSWSQGYAGSWTADVAAVSGCWPAFQIAFTVQAPDTNQSLMITGGSWHRTDTPAIAGDLLASVARQSGQFSVGFRAGTGRADFGGTGATPQRLVGVLNDPDGVLGPAGCAGTGTATRP